MLIKLSYPYIFGILDYRPSESALSSSDVCVSRIESIKCLFGKDVVAKHGPSALVIHGTLYFGIRGRAYLRPLSEDYAALALRTPPLSKSVLEPDWWRRGWQDLQTQSGYSFSCQDVKRALLYFK